MNLELKKRTPTLFSNMWSPESIFDVDLFDRMPDFFANKKLNIPSVNIKETPKSFELDLAAPGLTRKDFEIEVTENLLSISAEKEEVKEEEDGFTRKEFSYNSFCRTFRLPEYVNADKIDAKYDNGMLKIVIPKRKESPVNKRKHIDVS